MAAQISGPFTCVDVFSSQVIICRWECCSFSRLVCPLEVVGAILLQKHNRQTDAVASSKRCQEQPGLWKSGQRRANTTKRFKRFVILFLLFTRVREGIRFLCPISMMNRFKKKVLPLKCSDLLVVRE